MKRRIFKKMTSILLALAMIFSIVTPAFTVQAAETEDYGVESHADEQAKNLALGKNVTASYVDHGLGAGNAVDGNYGTYWDGAACGTDGKWLMVDLGETCRLTEIFVTTYVDGSRYYLYNIEVSNDGTEWTKVADRQETHGTVPAFQKEGYQLNEVEARYVRVTITYNNTINYAHMQELEVWGYTSVVRENIAFGKNVTASNSEYGRNPEVIVDGDYSNYWDGGSAPQSFTIDLGTNYLVDMMKAYPYADGSRYYTYDIEYSLDGTGFTTLFQRTAEDGVTVAGKTFALETPVEMRYVRVTMTHNSVNPSVHMKEFEVYGTLAPGAMELADYTKVNEAITKANQLDKTNYKDFSAVEAAIAAVVRNQSITEQAVVDGYAAAIEAAIAALEPLPYSADKLEKRVYEDSSGATMPYRLYVPEDYSSVKQYPVVVFLHGAGERGNDNEAQLVNAIKELFNTQPQFEEAIVIAPQCPAGKRWVETDWTAGCYNSDAIEEEQLAIVMKILAEIREQYSTDSERIYAIGLSMGGFGTWDLLTRHHDVFAAGIPICGSGDPSKADILSQIPIWTFHDTLDPVVPYSGTQTMYNSIKAAGGEKIKFVTYSQYGHGIWNVAASEPGLIDWLFEQKLSDRNLFDKDSSDNWMQSLTYNGAKLENTSLYANIFTTHKIPVESGETLLWGSFGKEGYVMELYDADDNFIKQVKFADTESKALGTKVAGVGGGEVDSYSHKYAVTDENAAYVRILGNISNIDTYYVYKTKTAVSDEANLFDKNNSDNWLKALSYNGSKLENTSTYANIFTTHKIDVAYGDTLEWGGFGKEQYVMELYGANDEFIKQVKFTEVENISLGTKVIGVGGASVDNYNHRYTITTSGVAYARILGNISTMDSFFVYKTNGELSGESILFVGDSITNAIKDDANKNGWAGRVGNSLNMAWTNAGVSGASVSTVRSGNRVLTQLQANSSVDFDYVILHGGVNDAMDSAEVGVMSLSFNPEDFDTSTFAGGLEELFHYAITEYQGSRIGYIVNYATPNSTWGGNTKDMSAYFRTAKQICDKWGIPYLNLYDGTVTVDGEELSYSYDILEMDTSVSLYAKDAGEVHIGGVGYDRISPYIAEWVQTLPVTEANTEVPVREWLNTLIAEAEMISGTAYTKKSFAQLKEAIEAAKAVVADENAEKEAMEAAYTAIETAVKGLNVPKNVAYKMTVTANCNQSNAYKITDGTISTSSYWESTNDGTMVLAADAEFVIDLDGTYDVSLVHVYPYYKSGQQRNYKYELFGSTDNETWFPIGKYEEDDYITAEGISHEMDVQVSYVKLKGIEGTRVGYEAVKNIHIMEVQVFGEEADNIALHKPVTSSTGMGDEKINDGDRTTYWEGVHAEKSWAVIELGDIYMLDKLNVINYWSASRYYHYEIYTSVDGVEYTKAAEKTSNNNATILGDTFILEEPVPAAYIKVVATFNSANSGFHIEEVRAYGTKFEPHTVTFSTGDGFSNQIVSTMTYNYGDVLVAPESNTYQYYIFKGWDIDGDRAADVQAGDTIEGITADTTYTAIYSIDPSCWYTVNFTEGSEGSIVSTNTTPDENGAYRADTLVKITAPETISDGTEKKFAGWYKGEELISANTSYSFYLKGNVELTAEYTKEEPEVKPAVTFSTLSRIDGYSANPKKDRASFGITWDSASGCTVLSEGILRVYANRGTQDDLTLETAKDQVKNQVCSKVGRTGSYTVNCTIGNNLENIDLYVRGYVTYRDKTGTVKTVYTNVETLEANGR